MRRIKPQFFTVIIFLVVGYLFFIKTKQNVQRIDVPAAPLASLSTTSASSTNSLGIQQGAPASTDLTKPSTEVADVQAMNDVAFKNWVQEEAKTLNSTNVNTDEKEIQMKALAQNLKPAQISQLARIVNDSQNSANEKILSAYLLTLRQDDDVLPLLVETVKKPLTDFGPPNAHSEAEFKHGQELALKFTFVDELAQRSKTNPLALTQLRSIASSAESVEIRSYAQRKLKEIGK